jgi:hypothetical protein
VKIPEVALNQICNTLIAVQQVQELVNVSIYKSAHRDDAVIL